MSINSASNQAVASRRSDIATSLDMVSDDLFLARRWASAVTHEGKIAAVFGSARAVEKSANYELAKCLGNMFALEGWAVLTGGGPGIMQAAQEGAGAHNSFAVRIHIETEIPRATLDPSRSVLLETFSLRKLVLIGAADALVIFPGGVGTQDELFEVLVLIDTGRLEIPVILMSHHTDPYWQNWLRFVQDNLVEPGYVSAATVSRLIHIHSIEQVQTVLQEVGE